MARKLDRGAVQHIDQAGNRLDRGAVEASVESTETIGNPEVAGIEFGAIAPDYITETIGNPGVAAIDFAGISPATDVTGNPGVAAIDFAGVAPEYIVQPPSVIGNPGVAGIRFVAIEPRYSTTLPPPKPGVAIIEFAAIDIARVDWPIEYSIRWLLLDITGNVIVGEADQAWQPPFICISTPGSVPGYNTQDGDGVDSSVIGVSCYGKTWSDALALTESVRLLFSDGYQGELPGSVWAESIMIRAMRQLQNFVQDGTQTGNPGYMLELEIMHEVALT